MANITSAPFRLFALLSGSMYGALRERVVIHWKLQGRVLRYCSVEFGLVLW